MQSPKLDAKDIAKKDEERLLEEKMEAEERVNVQDEEVRRSPETAVSIDTNASIDTSKAKTAGFRGSQGSNLNLRTALPQAARARRFWTPSLVTSKGV